jgi:hypothetical protein
VFWGTILHADDFRAWYNNQGVTWAEFLKQFLDPPIPAICGHLALVLTLEQHPTGKGTLFLGQRGPLGEDAVGRIVGKYAT